MTERIALELTVPQIDAAVKALQHCGVGVQNTQKLFQVFHDYDLVNASSTALKVLSSAERRSVSRSQAGERSDIQREANPKTPNELLREENNRLKADLKVLYSEYSHLSDSVQKILDKLDGDSTVENVRTQLKNLINKRIMEELKKEYQMLV